MRIVYLDFVQTNINLDDIIMVTDVMYERTIIDHVYSYEVFFKIYMKGATDPFKVFVELMQYTDYKYNENSRDGICIRQFVDGQENWTYVEHPDFPIKLDASFVPVMNLQRNLTTLLKLWKGEMEIPSDAQPIPMILFCPKCLIQHIDEPNESKGWSNPPHRSHECQNCGFIWRPADVFTTGVEKIQTKGKRDN